MMNEYYKSASLANVLWNETGPKLSEDIQQWLDMIFLPYVLLF